MQLGAFVIAILALALAACSFEGGGHTVSGLAIDSATANDGNVYAGGIAGYNLRGRIVGCHNTGNVTAGQMRKRR